MFAGDCVLYLSGLRQMLLPFKMTLTTFEYGEKVADGFQSHKIWSSKNNQQEEHHYTLHDTEPYRWQCKTSWVTINSKLSWKPCLNSVNKKANNTRGPGFLCRHMQGCPRKIEEQAYTCTSHLGICLLLLDPLTQEQAWKIEIVQRRAARFVMSDYTTQGTVSPRCFKHSDGN